MPTRVQGMLGEVHSLEQSCRDVLQFDSVFDHLIADQPAFDRVCAFLDFLGDSNGSIAAVSFPDQRKSFEPYFLAYGLLETVYSRQRTLIHLLKRFQVGVPNSLLDEAITNPRDRIIGHPLTTNDSAHVIVRNKLTTDGFEYSSYQSGSTTRGQKVVYDDIISLHLIAMRDGLTLLHSFLARIENDRRQRMRNQPISPLLGGMDYIIRCVIASTVEEKYELAVDGHIQMIGEALQKVRAALLKRMRASEVEHHVDHLVEGLNLLQEHVPLDSSAKRLRFRVIAEGVERGYFAIRKLAQDIDAAEAEDILIRPA